MTNELWKLEQMNYMNPFAIGARKLDALGHECESMTTWAGVLTLIQVVWVWMHTSTLFGFIFSRLGTEDKVVYFLRLLWELNSS